MSFKQLSVLTKNSVIGAAVSYLLTIYLANNLGAEMFGMYSYVLVVSGIIGLLVNYSSDTTAPKMLMVHQSEQSVFNIIISVRVAFMLLSTIALIVAVCLFEFSPISAFGVFCILLTSLNLAFLFEIKGRNIQYSYIFLVERLLYVAFVMVILSVNEPDIFSIFTLYLISTMISLVVQYKLKGAYIKTFTLPSKSDFIDVLRDNFSLVMVAMAQLAYGGFSRLIFEHKYGLAQLGVFSLGLQITAAASIFQAQVERVFRMSICAAIESKDMRSIIAGLKRYLLMSTLPIGLLAMVLTYWSEEFVGLLFSEDYQSLSELFFLFGSFFVIINLNSLMVIYWVALGEKQKYFQISITFAIILLLTLYFLPSSVSVKGFIMCILAIQITALVYALLRFYLLLKRAIAAPRLEGN